jgi:U4/U6 small nuclear ribonucleoprotein PRP31
MALADEFLADIEKMELDQEVSVNTDPVLKDTAMVTNDVFKTNNFLSNNSDISSVAKLKDSLLFEEIMKKIDFYTTHQRKSTMEIQGPVEDDPEYLLILDANNLLVKIDNEIDMIHHFVRMIYSRRFPELEQLVQLPMNYLQTIQELGNYIHRVNMNDNLLKFLTKATIMIISVTASTTRG